MHVRKLLLLTNACLWGEVFSYTKKKQPCNPFHEIIWSIGNICLVTKPTNIFFHLNNYYTQYPPLTINKFCWNIYFFSKKKGLAITILSIFNFFNYKKKWKKSIVKKKTNKQLASNYASTHGLVVNLPSRNGCNKSQCILTSYL
jgi:hypothetical protein